ncbi:MAG TPA: MlrC family protein [Clostridiales bacterium]|nr:MlrC family protein [Clostridiales bacterium]
MKKKIVVGSLRQETNSFSPVITVEDHFSVSKGQDMLNKIAVTEMFENAGFEVIPTICAYAIPSGKVDQKAYVGFKQSILDGIPRDGSVAGVWLYLHGAMNVVNIGSGEGPLVAEIRRLVGPGVPIAVALDFHANNTEELIQNANIICGYRTAPHVDGIQTQQRAADLLLRCIKENVLPQCVMVRPPLLFPGEMVTTGVEPAKSLIAELDKIEAQEGVWTASLFGCMPWTDAPNAGSSVVVCGLKESKTPLKEAKRLARMFWNARERFGFEETAAQPEKAIQMACAMTDSPVFISDSGDNVTGGAAGDNAYFLNLLLQHQCKNTLVAGITDQPATEKFYALSVGESLETSIGGTLDSNSTAVTIKGTLKCKGIFERDSKPGMKYVLVETDGIDIILTETRSSFTTQDIIEKTGAKVSDYHMIVVKLGYLFPDLRRIAKGAVMALTTGNCGLQMDRFDFHHIHRPMYPVDKDFDWEP